MDNREELLRIAERDHFGPDSARLKRDGTVTVWSRDGQPFEGEAFVDLDGGRHVLVPMELRVAQAMTVQATLHVPRLLDNAVRVVVLSATKGLLLLQRADSGVWEPIEGTTDDADAAVDETLLDTAHRELAEETGYAGPGLLWGQVGARTWLVVLPPGAGDPTISSEHVAFQWAPRADSTAWLAGT
jgi:hypothetical protein